MASNLPKFTYVLQVAVFRRNWRTCSNCSGLMYRQQSLSIRVDLLTRGEESKFNLIWFQRKRSFIMNPFSIMLVQQLLLIIIARPLICAAMTNNVNLMMKIVTVIYNCLRHRSKFLVFFRPSLEAKLPRSSKKISVDHFAYC